MRKIILTLIGLLIIVGAVFIAQRLAGMKEELKPVEQKVISSVYAQTVENTSTAVTLSTSGSLMARDRIDVFAEVQGVFESSAGLFKPGSYYKKGQTLLNLNSDEFRANIRAQKSNLHNQIVNFLPDLSIDYPDAAPRWRQYIRDFDEEKPLQPLPKTKSEREKLFVAGKGVYSTYHNISNLEERLVKYTIPAPFSGVLTEALVNPGALVSPGQRLGEFIRTGVYELETNINVAYMDLLKVGRSVEVYNMERTKTWTGKVVRVNGKLDQASQTVKVFIQLTGSGLKEGMYLEADLEAREIPNTFEMDRQLLQGEDKIFAINDNVLELISVTPAHFKESTVLIRGLTDGMQVLAKPVPGAYQGMRVEIIE